MSSAGLVGSKDIASVTGKTVRFINMRASKENWKAIVVNNRGDRRFYLNSLPEDVQKALAEKGKISIDNLPMLSPSAAFAAVECIAGEKPFIRDGFQTGFNGGVSDTWSGENTVDMTVISNPRVAKWTRIVSEAMNVPKGWKKRAWIEDVAARNKTTASTIYRQIKKYNEKGLAGLKHTKGERKARVWSPYPESVDWWVGLCLKKEHRKMAKDALYSILVAKSIEEGWKIGGYESALWWYNERVTPQLKALQRGGLRALDNILPPVLRNYSDLEPFEILVGDQHRFDFWVTDEETGEVFRPEGYFWQDLRTRCFYGGAIDRKYDSYLMGMALHMGLKIFGPFGSIYNDNGKPELSRYIMSILKDMRTIGLEAKQTVDAAVDYSCVDSEEINPIANLPGTQRLAIVKNAKAKMIEGTFNVLEGILRDHFMVPGSVALLGGDPNENDVDWAEINKFATQGKLLTYHEFVLTVLKAMDYYNGMKAHRGVKKEWKWRPIPKTATPADCLKRCVADGWKPVMLSQEAIDLVFLPRAERVVDKGRITFQNEVYESDKLITLHKKRVELRYNPLDPDWLLVFDNGRFIARAEPVAYSSMKDRTLAQQKIEEKRRRRKGFLTEYRELTSGISDMREFSKTSVIEKAAAAIGKERKALQEKNKQIYRDLEPDEMAREVEKLESRSQAPEVTSQKKLPSRPSYFLTELDRYKWTIKYESAGGELTPEDISFKVDYESRMNDDQREHWEAVKQYGG